MGATVYSRAISRRTSAAENLVFKSDPLHSIWDLLCQIADQWQDDSEDTTFLSGGYRPANLYLNYRRIVAKLEAKSELGKLFVGHRGSCKTHSTGRMDREPRSSTRAPVPPFEGQFGYA